MVSIRFRQGRMISSIDGGASNNRTQRCQGTAKTTSSASSSMPLDPNSDTRLILPHQTIDATTQSAVDTLSSEGSLRTFIDRFGKWFGGDDQMVRLAWAAKPSINTLRAAANVTRSIFSPRRFTRIVSQNLVANFPLGHGVATSRSPTHRDETRRDKPHQPKHAVAYPKTISVVSSGHLASKPARCNGAGSEAAASGICLPFLRKEMECRLTLPSRLGIDPFEKRRKLVQHPSPSCGSNRLEFPTRYPRTIPHAPHSVAGPRAALRDRLDRLKP